ncbi:MAG: hypothetical protein N4A68_08440 [Maledivibacter sp.]|jgi:hypothetical protein|nr:hypothetical protein [Maledivibacter sp.]
MNGIDLSIILSIIGCITGISGLILHFYRFLLERPNLKIIQPVDDASYYFPAPSNSHFKTTYHSFMFVTISNRSEKHIAISS